MSDGADFAATLAADDLPAAGRAFGLTMAGASALVASAYAARRNGA